MAADPLRLDGGDIRRLLPPAQARLAVAAGVAALRSGAVEGPLRTAVPSPDGPTLLMPALSRRHVGLKVLHLRPGNPAKGLPAIVGEMLLWDRASGRLLAVLDGAALTAVRTAALAGHATALLKPARTQRVGLLGAGGQAFDQALALCEATGAEEIRLWNRTRERADALALRLAERLRGVRVEVTETPAAAAEGAGALTTVTSSPEPLLFARDLPAEVHLNAMGAFRPDMAELAPEIVGGASLVCVDDVAAAWQEAGELLQAEALGLLRRSEVALLPELVPQRRGCTLFKSVGAAAYDLAVAQALVTAAAPGA